MSAAHAAKAPQSVFRPTRAQRARAGGMQISVVKRPTTPPPQPGSVSDPGSATVAPILARQDRQIPASKPAKVSKRATTDAQVSALLVAATEAADGAAWMSAHSRAIPLLSPSEELELARAWRDRRDRAARDRLTLANLRLVMRMAGNALRLNSSLDSQDLFQEGVIGLLKAIDHFDPGQGYRLTTYATWWIAQTMQRAAASTGHPIRLPQHAYEQRKRLLRLRDRYTLTHGHEPTTRELAEIAGIKPDQVARVIAAGLTPASLDQPLAYQAGTSSKIRDADATLGELLAAPDADMEFSSSEQEDSSGEWILALARRVLQVGCGTAREQLQRQRAFQVWRARVIEGVTLREVGDRYGVSRERVRQIEAKAREKIEPALRDALACEGRNVYGEYGEELR